MVVHASNLSTQEDEAGGLQGMQEDPEHSELYAILGETHFQNKNK